MKNTIVCCLLFGYLSIAFANSTYPSNFQSKPDLSGTWTLDLSSSDFGGTPRKDLLYDAITLTIVHSGPEVKIVRTMFKKKSERSQDLVYFSDDVTVKEVVSTQAMAEAEVQGLNELNADKHCKYFWQVTRLFPEGRSAGNRKGETA